MYFILLIIFLLWLIFQKTTEHIVNNHYIIITLTTSPNRIHNIKPVIDCIFNQTIPPNYIYLNLPYVYKRTNEKFLDIPSFLIHPKIILNYTNDIGPATKIIPTLRKNFPNNTLIISIDDDIYYQNTMIENMIKYHNKYPDYVLTSSTYRTIGNQINIFDLPYKESTMIEGYAGVAYPYKLVKNIYFNLDLPKVCYFSDDFFISNYLLNNNIKIMLIGGSKEARYHIKPLDYGLQQDALHKGGAIGDTQKPDVHFENYKKCAKYFNNIDKLDKKLDYWL
jgi:hypothetical protein